MSATPLHAVTEAGRRTGFDASFDARAWAFFDSEKDRVIDLILQLQSSLCVETILAGFSEHLSELLPHCGIAFWSVQGRLGTPDKCYTCGLRTGVEWRVPLFSGARELGRLVIYLDAMPQLDQRKAAESLIRYLIQPLHNAVRFERMQSQALLDELTGVGSRMAFTEAMRSEIARARRAQGNMQLALLVMDLDGFKRLNDEFGHLAGDLALKRVATVARCGLRACDRLFRFGGDEFVAVLPDTDVQSARTAAKRLESLVREQCTTPQLEISIGAAAWRSDMSPDELFAAADQALYVRKRERKEGLRPEHPANSRTPHVELSAP